MPLLRALHLLSFVALAARAVSAYNETIGLQLAYLEKAVYCGQQRFDAWNVGDTLVHGPDVNSSQVRYVQSKFTNAAAGVGRIVSPPSCFVAVQGTVGTMGMVLDALFWQMDFPRNNCEGCKVTTGFYQNYESIRPRIFQALGEYGCRDVPLYLTGHSLGGAGMQYLLWDVLRDGYDVRHAYALEAPRPGNAEFAQALQQLTQGVDAWRVSHRRDVVVHVPPAALGYSHALKEIYYADDNDKGQQACAFEDGGECSGEWWPWQLTYDDHEWFLDVNPCDCSNSSGASLDAAGFVMV